VVGTLVAERLQPGHEPRSSPIVQIALPDPAGLWTARGFALDVDGRFTVGAIGLRAGLPELGLDTGVEPAGPDAHPNGASAVDHLVMLTPDVAATGAELTGMGAQLRREIGRLHFFRLGPLILEVVLVEDGPARFWGLTFTVPELPTGELVGDAREAVQPGRRIVTARGGTTPVAFITPRP
jgi:hypothetical protein